MRAKREYRDREGTQVTVLDALVERNEDGMTVFELRAAAEVGIDQLEEALARLNDDDLIVVDDSGTETVIKPADRVVPDRTDDGDEGGSIGDWLRDRFPF